MPKVTKKVVNKEKPDKVTIQAKTVDRGGSNEPLYYSWWLAGNDQDLKNQLLSTFAFLQMRHQNRVKNASIYTTVYAGKPLYNYALNNKMKDIASKLPPARPTVNVTQSCIDTLVSRLGQARPKPVFLTDAGDYAEQSLSKQMTTFISGELYRTDAYELVDAALRDGCVIGDGFLKVVTKDKKNAVERILSTEIFVDDNDGFNGKPRALIQARLIDRSVAIALFPKESKELAKATKAVVTSSDTDSSDTVSDQIILVEGWHLPSSEDADDGRHAIVCSEGVLRDTSWDKDHFPFVQLQYNPGLVGFYSQGLAEMLSGTQIEINKLLATMSQAINLIGVPRIFIDEMSKVLETAFNNNVGTIIKYRGTKPIYEVAECVPQEMYAHLERLIQYAYQISGISALSAASQKPAGLNSGEAIRSYDDLQTDRFAALAKRRESVINELSYLLIDNAKDIVEEHGSYSTVYPNKDGTKQIDLPKADILKDTYVIQCFDESSLPKDPAGRQAKLSEMLASQEITLKEYRRLSNFPDLEQSDKLANALEERVTQILSNIVEKGKSGYETPTPFMLDPEDTLTKLSVQYINLYSGAKLPESKMQLLRDFFTQSQALKQKALPSAPLNAPGAPPQGAPAPNDPNAAPPPAAPPTPNSAVSQA